MSVRRSVGKVATWILGPTFSRHYVRALRVKGRTIPYDAKSAWTLRYESAIAEDEFGDATTLARGANPFVVRYHYNAVENAILEHALRRGFPSRPTVLDVGSGAGHWIDFYRDAFAATEVVGVEISASASRALAGAYADVPAVTIVEADIAAESFELGRRFDVVNAVGVLFHIVDDRLWRRAVRHLAGHLEPGGRLVVAEHLGLVTHDADFRRIEPRAAGARVELEAPRALVTKRIRSARRWRTCAAEAGLEVLHVARIRKSRMVRTPANRLLVFAPAGSKSGFASRSLRFAPSRRRTRWDG
jgi:SAM-dependent methyltransferase